MKKVLIGFGKLHDDDTKVFWILIDRLFIRALLISIFEYYF